MSKRDIDFITAENWPAFPLLAFTKRGAKSEDNDYLGFMHANHPLTIYVGNMLMIPGNPGDGWEEVLRGYPYHTYETLDDLLKEYRID